MLRSMAMRVVQNYLLVAVVASLSGCAYGELNQVIRSQVATEADCADVVVEPTSPYAPGYKPNQYTVKGCGVERVYTCKKGGLVEYGHADCTFTAGGNAPAKPDVAPAPPGDGPDNTDLSAEPDPLS
jgi:hypothetical protein